MMQNWFEHADPPQSEHDGGGGGGDAGGAGGDGGDGGGGIALKQMMKPP
jgi:hypothetical protein